MTRNDAIGAGTTIVQRSFPALSILGLIFVCAKLFTASEVALWSWWLVLLPFYAVPAVIFGSMALVLVLLFAFILFCKIALSIFEWTSDMRRARHLRKAEELIRTRKITVPTPGLRDR